MARVVFARLHVHSGAAHLSLTLIPSGSTSPPPPVTSLPSLLAAYASLPSGHFSHAEVRVSGLRATRRQKWGKHLQFLALRCPSGEVIEAIMRLDLARIAPSTFLSTPQGAISWASFQLGDVLCLTGLVESCKGKLSIHPRLITVEESWASLFDGGRYVDHPPPPLICGNCAAVATAMVQCASSHARRLEQYLSGTLETRTIAIVPPVQGASGRDVKRDERCLLLSTPDPSALCDAISADPHVSRVVQRWYVLQGKASTLDAAVDGLRNLLALRGATPATPLSARIHAYPRALEAKLVGRLRQGGEVEPRQRCELLVCLVYAFGFISYGIAEGARFQGEVCTAGADDGAVSRAFYKLREVASRCELPLDDRAHAIDVGSSPGGWSFFLAQSGCGHVSSVDPGLLRLPDDPCVSRIDHMKMRVGEALPILTERGASLDCYVCDMNARPSIAVGYLLEALPLLVSASPVVLTMKNTYKKKMDFEEALAEALAQLNAIADDDGFRVVHLLANTQKELTVVGRLR